MRNIMGNFGQGEGCGGIVADGKQAREEHHRAAVVASVCNHHSPPRAVRYRVTRAAGLALNKKKEKEKATTVACELVLSHQWPEARSGKDSHLLLTKKGRRGSGGRGSHRCEY